MKFVCVVPFGVVCLLYAVVFFAMIWLLVNCGLLLLLLVMGMAFTKR
jgi:hypothetical protein